MTAHVHAEVIKALADDESLEVQNMDTEGKWVRTKAESVIGLVSYQTGMKFRIKPHPKALSWANIFADGRVMGCFPERAGADANARDRQQRTFVLEVRDDGTAHLHPVEA